MAALFRRLVGRPRPMTEAEAYMAYVAHVRDHGCAAGGKLGWREQAICADGQRLREAWTRAAAAQNQGIQPVRRESMRSGR